MQYLISICVTKFSMLNLFFAGFFLFTHMMTYLEAKVGRVLLLKPILMLLIIIIKKHRLCLLYLKSELAR